MLGNKEAIVMRSPHTATGEEPPLASTREKPTHNNEDPARPKINETNRSVQFSHSVVSGSMGPHGLQHIRLLCPSPTPRAYSNSCPSSWWCHPTISSSVVPSSSRLQSFLASGSFPMSQFFASGGQSIGVSASASLLPMNIQNWFPLGWTGWISLLSKGPSRVFSNATIQKHQFNLKNFYYPEVTSMLCRKLAYMLKNEKINQHFPATQRLLLTARRKFQIFFLYYVFFNTNHIYSANNFDIYCVTIVNNLPLLILVRCHLL